jgi:hypothetical protein
MTGLHKPRMWLLCLLALLASHGVLAQPSARAAVLAPGDPPLTQPMVDRVTGLLGDLLGKPLDAQQRERMRANYIGHWRTRSTDDMRTMVALDGLAQALPQATPAERTQVLQQLREQLIAGLRAAAPNDPDARWLLALHDEAQRGARAPAPPPLLAPPARAAPPQAAPAAPAVAQAPAAAPAAPPATAARPVPAANAAANAAAQAASTPLPAAAPGAPGLRYAAPPGWAAETVAGGTVIFSRMLDQNREAQHQATIWLFAPQAAPQGPAVAFLSEWRSKLGGPNGYALGDVVAHYRRVLPGGPVAYYMGNAFTKGNDRDQDYYSALYVIDLLDGRTQTVGVTVVIGRAQYSMSQQNITDAMRQLVPAMAPLLDSLRYPDARAPGPLVAAREVQGNWSQSASAFGGSYVYAATGQSAGVAAASSGSTLNLQADGRYAYTFASYFNSPVAGQGGTATNRHNGRWALQQQVIVLTPDRALGDDPSEMAVGSGVLNTPQGPRRMLITVGRGRDGQYRQPPWFALWDSYDGAMKWYREDN